MDVREKLVEILKQTPFEGRVLDEWWFEEKIKKIADHLIQHGVTVQEWVSVEDRLPEENTTVIVATDNGIVFQCLYSYDGWNLWDGNEVNITHWQPMPQPPKVV